MRSPPLKEKSQAADVEAALEVSTISSSFRSQPKLSCDRPLTHRLIDFGQTISIPLVFKAFQSFGYNLGEVIGAEIQFIEKDERAEKQFHRLDIPLTYVFVKSPSMPNKILPSRESTISPAISLKSNESLNHRFSSSTKARVS